MRNYDTDHTFHCPKCGVTGPDYYSNCPNCGFDYLETTGDYDGYYSHSHSHSYNAYNARNDGYPG